MKKRTKVKMAIELSEEDSAKLKTVKDWLSSNGLPDVGSIHDSYLYRVGLDLSFNQASGKLDRKAP